MVNWLVIEGGWGIRVLCTYKQKHPNTDQTTLNNIFLSFIYEDKH